MTLHFTLGLFPNDPSSHNSSSTEEFADHCLGYRQLKFSTEKGLIDGLECYVTGDNDIDPGNKSVMCCYGLFTVISTACW